MANYTLKAGDFFCIPEENEYFKKGMIRKEDGHNIMQHLPFDSDEGGGIKGVTLDENGRYIYSVTANGVLVYDAKAPNCPIVKKFTTAFAMSVTCGDGLVLMASRTTVVLYDVSNNWTPVRTWSNGVYGQRHDYASAKLSEDGSTIIKKQDADNGVVEIVKVSDFSVTHTFTGSASEYDPMLFISKTGKYALYQPQNAQLHVQDLENNSSIGVIYNVPDAYVNANTGYSLTDEDYMIITSSKSTSLKVLDLPNLTQTSVFGSSVATNFRNLYKISDTKLGLMCLKYTLSKYGLVVLEMDDINNTVFESETLLTGSSVSFCTLIKMDDNPSATSPYEISDVISETLSLDDFDVSVFDMESGALQSKTVHQAGAFTVPVYLPDPVAVTITPHVNKGVWKPTTLYDLDDMVYSDDPLTDGWIQKCTQAGTSASFAPTWQNTAGTQFADGSVIWEVVEPIQMPITKSPVLPTPT